MGFLKRLVEKVDRAADKKVDTTVEQAGVKPAERQKPAAKKKPGETASRVDRLPMFLHWADTLGGDVTLAAVPYGETFHLHARGMLPGTEFAADLVVIVDGADYPLLAEEVGPGEDEIPVTREQLTKIAAATS